MQIVKWWKLLWNIRRRFTGVCQTKDWELWSCECYEWTEVDSKMFYQEKQSDDDFFKYHFEENL